MVHPSSATAAAIRFRFYLFGVFRIESERGLLRLPRRKVEALLVYLLLHPEKHPRDKLATLFWGDSPDTEARHSLRTALTTLRAHLDPNLLLTDRETIQFNPNYPVWVDVIEFQKRLEHHSQLLDVELPILPDQSAIPEGHNVSHLQAAIRLYQGDFLADFYDDWVLLERDQYRAGYLDALLRLTQEMRAHSEYERAIALAQQVLASDPANERAHQHLMVCFVARGDRNAALKQYETCRRLLQEELAVEPLPETTALYQWIKGTSFERGGLEARLTNLPIPLTSFIGRQLALAEVKQLLTPLSLEGARGEGFRLLTLTGAGGSGKTRLAIQAATELVDAFKDGVWWVELAALTEGTLVSQAVTKALGVPETSNQPLIELLVNFLQPRQLLLVLDNCEHLVNACAHLAAELLGACPYVQILATSREALGFTGEVAWPVPTLSVPDRPDVSPRQLLRQFESTRLFVERAEAVKRDFDLTLQNAPAVTEICRRLDGIPLAIELAAARVKVLSVEEIAARLDDRFNLLTQGSRTALPRQQTLRSTIDWSYDLLTEPERALYRRLAVFAGGFTLEAVEAVCAEEVGQDGILPHNVLDLLTHLIDKSLVVVDSEGQGGITRYRLLETMRQYAWEKLSESGELEQRRSRHLAFFLHWAEEAESKLRSAEQLIWLQRLEAEHDNLRAALHWAQETGEVETMLRLAGAPFWFWVLRSYLGEGRGWLEQALAAGEVSVPTSVRAQAFYGAAYLARVQGDFAGARKLVEQSIEMWRALNPADKSGLAHALVLLGWLLRDEGDPAAGRAIIEEGVALFREQGDGWGLAWSLLQLGLTIRDQEEYSLAQSTIEESLTLWRGLGDAWGLARAVHDLGLVAYRRGDYEAAYSVMEEALIIRRELGDKLLIGYSLHCLGVFTLAQGDPERARPFLEQALVLFRELGDKSGIALSIQYQGFFAQFESDNTQAELFFEQGLILAQETGPRWVNSNFLLGLAGVAAGRDQLERAARLCGAATANLAASASFWDAFERSYYERTVAVARAGLGEELFALAQTEGQAMTLEQAVACALQKEIP